MRTSSFILSIVFCIGKFESNDNDYAVGQANEVSRYQITPKKWKEVNEKTGLPHGVTYQQKIAMQYCEIIVAMAMDRGAKTPREIYAIYNGGYRGRNRPVVQERARIFEKLWKQSYDPNRKK